MVVENRGRNIVTVTKRLLTGWAELLFGRDRSSVLRLAWIIMFSSGSASGGVPAQSTQ
jgi:hypothetical protein